jgi:hypothetical protein
LGWAENLRELTIYTGKTAPFIYPAGDRA